MGVHNLAEYVAQGRAREAALRAAQSQSQPAPSQPTPPKPKHSGVNPLHSFSAYQSNILNADPSTLVVLDCFATWCGPCKVIAPKVATMSETYSQAKFFKVDVDEASDVAQELGIRAMPTFLLFKGGEKVAEVVGANERALEEAVKRNL